MRAPFVALLAASLAACVGDVPTNPGPGSNPGGDNHDAAVDDSGGPIWLDSAMGSGSGSAVDCIDPQTNYGNGHHNSGKSCMQSCHNHGFTLAGTLYTGAKNNTAYAGATITVTDKNGVKTNLVVNANGNFYTSSSIAFPVTVYASSCPYGVPMQSPAANGDCNSGNCHDQLKGTAGQIHLP